MNSRNALRERGSELVEFAFAVTILFTLIFGIMGFAQAAYTYHFVSSVAREATRYASVRGSACTLLPTDCPITDDEIVTYAKSLVPGGINASKLSVTPNHVNPGGSCKLPSSPGCAVSVTVQYPFAFLPMLNLPAVTMTSTSQMVISQ
jgi:Flp pilus assembly protein TadG